MRVYPEGVRLPYVGGIIDVDPMILARANPLRLGDVGRNNLSLVWMHSSHEIAGHVFIESIKISVDC